MDLWPFVLLALGGLRITRLLGWDEFPPIASLRSRLLGEWFEPVCPSCRAERTDYERREDHVWVGLDACPNCSSKEEATFVAGHDRPLLAELFQCPFCLGFWVCLAVFTAWLIAPHLTLLALAPFALSMVVGILAKNLDH